MKVRETEIWYSDGKDQVHQQIRTAARILREGGLIAFPTETVYGLGADARSDEAVQRIYEAKGRPADNPLIVHIARRQQLADFASPPDAITERLMARFWPGPLTVVLPVQAGKVSALVTAGLDTVAVRMPDHAVALALIAAAGCPVAAPSANRSGRPSPTRAAHVLADLRGRIDGVVDSGPTGVGLESTVVHVRDGVVHVLRPGGITLEQLRAVHPQVRLSVDAPDAGGPAAAPLAAATAPPPASPALAPRAPGMKYAHYAPQGALTLVLGAPDQVAERILAELEWARAADQRTGVLVFAEHAHAYISAADEIVTIGSLAQPDEAARELYDALRQFDDAGVTVIYAEGWPENGIGITVMNRLRKAAAGRIIDLR